MRRVLVLAFMIATAVAAVGIGVRSADAQIALPVANPGGPYTGVVGVPITMSGAASTGVNLTFSWSFGDGTTGVGPVVSKVYSAPGVYTVTLTVADAFGQVSSASTTATVTLGPGAGPFCGGSLWDLACTSTPVVPPFTAGCFLTSAGVVCPGQFAPSCFLTSAGVVCPGGTIGVPGFLPFIGGFFSGTTTGPWCWRPGIGVVRCATILP